MPPDGCHPLKRSSATSGWTSPRDPIVDNSKRIRALLSLAVSRPLRSAKSELAPGPCRKSPDGRYTEVDDEACLISPSGDRVAAQLRGFGPLGILAILVILAGNFVVAPLSAILVLVWARRSCTPWREIGYVRPVSWAGSLAIGIAFGIAFKFLMKAVVMPLLGADPINQAYQSTWPILSLSKENDR